ncbi:enoyl-CoA hydratase/isomerase family protein [Bacillus sp. FJAT-45037]|uniref:enoyl-CoA hydratase/isomerase family protein n=1 Tax=Bacillus sp. FJAT-45037 TaxID=2011007 RepID=UPI000C2497B3|nr:enoyl-CoA hydratase/isomerase family protein [Bacillus sp. FJAT-45037]
MSQEIVLYNVLDQVATITLNRPHVKNALDTDMHAALYRAFDEANRDESVKVIVLEGSDGAFSAGADLKSIATEEVGSLDYGYYLRETYNKLILQMMNIKKPIVAHINGIAVGAGLSIALACDYRVAAREAKLGLGFMKIGLVPDAGASYFLPRLVGLGKATELALGEIISAEEAERINLINQVGTPEKLVEHLKSVSLVAFGLMKKNFREGFSQSLADVLETEVETQRIAGATKEHKQAVMQFVNRG